jgi:putative peptidoglycan lipid II flippase
MRAGMSQMLKSSGAMAAATLSSRLLGMAREMVYARFMGDSPEASAFKFALVVPNMFRRLLGEGALSAAFIPIFKEQEKTLGDQEMWRSANAVISGLIVVASAVIALGFLAVSLGLHVRDAAPATRLMLQLARVMLPYLLLACLAAVMMGMLNARGYFFIPALGPAVLNVVMIGSVLWLAPRLGRELQQQIFALAIGVVVAGLAQAAFQLPCLWREGFRFHWVRPWPNPTVQRVVRQMIPATVGVAAYQINVLCTQSLAFWTDKHIVAAFDYAVRLMELPQGLFGISMATYLLPTLSGLAAEKNWDQFRATFRQGLGYVTFTNAIAAALLIALANPIVRLLFERGQFDQFSTRRVSVALVCLAPGLLSFSAVNITARAFFALGDTKTPMQISVVALLVNIGLVAVLVGPLRQAGMGIANTLSSILNLSLLLYALRRKLGRIGLEALRGQLLFMVGAAVAAGLVAWAGAVWWNARLGHGSLLLKLGHVFGPATVALGLYVGGALACRVSFARDILELALGRFARQRQQPGPTTTS